MEDSSSEQSTDHHGSCQAHITAGTVSFPLPGKRGSNVAFPFLTGFMMVHVSPCCHRFFLVTLSRLGAFVLYGLRPLGCYIRRFAVPDRVMVRVLCPIIETH